MDMSAQYEEMNNKGLAALASGDVKAFSGVDYSLKNRLILASCWSVPVEIELLFVTLMWGIETTDFSLIKAGTDYPMHSTLKQAKVPDGCPWPEKVIRQSLGQSALVAFDTLIMDGGNLLLAASNVPDELVAMRRSLDQELVRLGLEPLPLSILHITLARMGQVPASVEKRQRVFAPYQEAMSNWRKDLAKHPITLNLESNVRVTSVYDLLTAPF